MTIKEKSDKFLDLLRYAYRAQKKETIQIDSKIFEKSGLDIQELEDLICPDLCERGYLKVTNKLLGCYLCPKKREFMPIERVTSIYGIEYHSVSNEIAIETTYWITVNGRKLNEKPNEDLNSRSMTTFNSQNGVIRCGDIKPYSFHRGLKGDRPLLKLFRKLWEERQHFLNKKERKNGEPFPTYALATQVEVTEKKLLDMLKYISRMFKSRKFPAKIERKNGALLVVTDN